MLKLGDPAPNFELPNADLEMTQLADFSGKKNLVLYFYPKDDTPGCTIEALEFSDLHDEFSELDTEILGISHDNCLSHGAFRDKHGLTIRLLADIDGVMCEDYDVWREKEAHGEKRMGILRSTFVIDKNGIVQHPLYDTKPKGHVEQVLELVKAL
ncbi:peroxiredoxin [Solemya velesiana gill symbiont]|uniref:thioredoxin-dependent peroxiredoxin n=1 Tax=Solemya velesiana gill symbiont TaxID=1918948 RepID=A0A1T2KYC7_9GAMM|nr:peroxiredoxin [Solemya velesiana gill symbiont]OOZ37867.1 peroxiredoxin [Solemya velesiana gill symbiont]